MRHADPDQYQNRRSLKMLGLILAVITLGAAIGVGAYGLFLKPRLDPHPDTVVTPTATPLPAPTPTPSRSAQPQRDPEVFAIQVSRLLFDWDTHLTTPSAITETLIGLADPTGNETAGLASDIRNYLPDAAVWAKLRDYQTSQRLDIATVTVPEAWEKAAAEAQPGSILPGTVAYTITGTRHRQGVWQDQPTTSDHEVTFTVFVTCAPSFPECHLMRLSQLDNPLR
jgi:hypothetical protein